jgi:serine/threonine-protein kinase
VPLLMSPEQVAELSRLLDEALALDPGARASWIDKLEQTRPATAQHLRSMLAQSGATDTGLLPRLPKFNEEAVAQTGERVGPYVLVREIGRGGMGSVWLAERADGAFKRRVALKLPRLAWAPALGKRMAREREIGALLEHANIARLYDAGVDEHGRPYIAMEYIEGQPIDVYCRDHALGLSALLKLFLQVVKAVAYAHGRLVLHRDLKPGNVLVDAGGQAHLLDFGIAKLLDEAATTGTQLTQEQGRVLTLSYAAPEQIAGRPLAVTADVYALGVMLYELLTGTLPYRTKRDTPGALEEAILAGDAPLASGRMTDKETARALRGDMDAILGKAIKREPSERYPTADALAADIQRYLDGQAIEARPDSAWYRLRKAVIRHKVPVIAASAVLVVALIGLTTTLVQGQRVAGEAERTRLATAFVSELFRLNATQQSSMTDGTARARPAVFVDRGAQLIEERFRGQPELQAELYGAVGRVYVDLGVDRLATEYATRQLASLRAQRASETRIARSLMLLSEVALSAERDSDAEDFAQQAVNAVRSNDALAPEALALLARTQFRRGKTEQATQTHAEGRRMLEALGKSKSLARAWLTFVEATLISRQNRFDEARQLYERAIVQAVEAEGPTSTAAVDMRLHLAEALIHRNHPEAGRKHLQAGIAALEELGGMSRVRAARVRAEFQAYQAFAKQVSYPETFAVLGEVSTFLRSQASAIPPEVLAEVEFRTATAHVDWGEYELAKPLLDSSVAALLNSTQSLVKQYYIATYRGWCAMYLGDHEVADRYIRQEIDLRNRMGQANFPLTAMDWAGLALNKSMQGRHREAEDILRSVPIFSDLQGDPLSGYAQLIPQMLARVRLDAGDIRGAQQAIPAKEPAREDWIENGSYYQTRGEIRCASGDRSGGLEDLTRSIRSQGAVSSPNHPWVARARAVAGLCALEQGNRKQAQELAHEARRAFVAQPNVSPYFKEPLKRLDKQLGVKAI